jgi:hypothetical protein
VHARVLSCRPPHHVLMLVSMISVNIHTSRRQEHTKLACSLILRCLLPAGQALYGLRYASLGWAASFDPDSSNNCERQPTQQPYPVSIAVRCFFRSERVTWSHRTWTPLWTWPEEPRPHHGGMEGRHLRVPAAGQPPVLRAGHPPADVPGESSWLRRSASLCCICICIRVSE